MREAWRPYKNSLVSNYGRVWTWPKIRVCGRLHQRKHIRIYGGGLLKCGVSPLGYPRVNLDGTPEHVHRIVAMLFVDGYSCNLTVNHIDGVKTNNKSSNLEWVTNLENVLHAKRAGLSDPRRPVLCVDTGERFPSVSDAALSLGMAKGNLSSHLNGKQKSFGGMSWAYI